MFALSKRSPFLHSAAWLVLLALGAAPAGCIAQAQSDAEAQEESEATDGPTTHVEGNLVDRTSGEMSPATGPQPSPWGPNNPNPNPNGKPVPSAAPTTPPPPSPQPSPWFQPPNPGQNPQALLESQPNSNATNGNNTTNNN
jgi:hypothetical protein